MIPEEKSVECPDLMIMAAFRYCLGRQTYIASECAEWLEKIWPEITPSTQELIIKEIKEAINKGRISDIDLHAWERLLFVGGEDSETYQSGRMVVFIYADGSYYIYETDLDGYNLRTVGGTRKTGNKLDASVEINYEGVKTALHAVELLKQELEARR